MKQQGGGLRGGVRAPVVVLISLSALAWAIACGGGDDSGSGGDGSGTGGKGGISLGQGGDGAEGTGTLSDGGRVDLSEEEIAAINGAACTGWSGEGENLPAVLQLVVDVSGSMDDPPADTSDPNAETKWDITSAALKDALDNLPPSVSVGVLFYPNKSVTDSDNGGPVTDCINVDDMIDIAQLGNAGSAQRTAISTGIDDASVASRTPTYDAYAVALSDSLVPYQTSARKFMLLITDGAPTVAGMCTSTPSSGRGPGPAPTDPIVDMIEGALSDFGIRTFLIGSPGSEDTRDWLSEAAVVGGTASDGCMQLGPEYCHMDMTQEEDFSQALTDGLASVVGQIVDDCTFKVPEPPDGETIDPERTNLIIRWGDGSASLILPDEVGDCTDGWTFDSEGQVVLCDATCAEVKKDDQAAVDLTFGCSTDEIINPIR